MALKYVCDECGDMATWVIYLEESGPNNQVHVIAQADACATDLGTAVIEVGKIEEGTSYGDGWQFHTIHIDKIDQDSATAKDLGI